MFKERWNTSIFFPPKQYRILPFNDHGIPWFRTAYDLFYKEMYMDISGETISDLVPSEKRQVKNFTLFYFHGNSADATTSTGYCQELGDRILTELTKLYPNAFISIAIIIFEYPGYAPDDTFKIKNITPQTITDYTENVANYIYRNHSAENCIFLGYSIGTGFCVRVLECLRVTGQKEYLKRVILLAPFTNLTELASRHSVMARMAFSMISNDAYEYFPTFDTLHNWGQWLPQNSYNVSVIMGGKDVECGWANNPFLGLYVHGVIRDADVVPEFNHLQISQETERVADIIIRDQLTFDGQFT